MKFFCFPISHTVYGKVKKCQLTHTKKNISESPASVEWLTIKRFIGKNSNQYLLFSLPRRVRDHIHPWKRNTHTHRSWWNNVIKWMVTWRGAFYNNFRLTARFSLLALIFRGVEQREKSSLHQKWLHSLYNYIHNKYMNFKLQLSQQQMALKINI